MTVEELMKELSDKNPKAKVMVISPHIEDAYLEVCDCEEKFSHLVTIGTSFQVEF